jgi:hypothetical protein
MHYCPLLGILPLAEKKPIKQKAKFLNWSVWETQAKAISSASLGDTVLSHTASESTGLV